MSEGAYRFVVAHPGTRLDRLVADQTGQGRRAVRAWLRDGRVRVNGHIRAASDIPDAGSEITVEDEARGEPPPAPASLRVLFEDDRRVVLAKPAGVHCERGRSRGSVAELLEDRYGDAAPIGDREEEGGLGHRIDRDTSGVLVAARTRPEYLRLRAAFRSGEALKQYLALCSGELPGPIEVDLPLARRTASMTVAGPYDEPLAATTWLEPLESGESWTLVLATMRTGVMHQIRVHMAASGHPLFGDSLYGGPTLDGTCRSGQLLHALRVSIAGDIDVCAPPPADFVSDYARLRRSGRRA